MNEAEEVLEETDDDTSDELSFEEVLARFIAHIDSLAVTIDPMLYAINLISKRNDEHIKQYAKQKSTFYELNEGVIKANFDSYANFVDYYKLIAKNSKFKLANKMIPRSIIISLISQFDLLIGNIIRVLSEKQPKSLNIGDKSLTFAQIQNLGSIDEAREYLIEEEIDSVLRLSHFEQIKWLEKKYELPLRKDLKIWPTFIELTERRNLFVHSDGIISSQYLSVCKEHEVPLSKDICLGYELGVTRKYFKSAYACIFEMGVGLAHVLWRKVLPDDLEAADINLNSICYDLLEAEKYKLACVMLDFTTKVPKRYSSELDRLMFVVNRAQAYKWSGDKKTCESILAGIDWSASNASFRLAKAVLLEDFRQASQIMREIGTHGDVDKDNYRTWPLFKEFRKSDEFIQTFQDIFGESFYTSTIESISTEHGINTGKEVVSDGRHEVTTSGTIDASDDI